MKKVIVITLVTTLAGIGTAAADHHKGEGRGGRGGKMCEHMFSKLDADGDGRISRSEWLDGKLSRFDKADLNGDGVITRDEIEQAKQAWKEQRAERGDSEGRKARKGRGHGKRFGKMMFKRLADEDGNVTRAAAEAAATQRFEKIDADNDGYVTQDEMKAGFRHMKGKRGERGKGHGKGKRGASQS